MRILILVVSLLIPAVCFAETGADKHETGGRSIYKIVKGDTLWDIASKQCGSPYKWRKIYEGNTELIKDPHWIYPGQGVAVTCLKDGGIKVEPVSAVELAAAEAAAAPEPEPQPVVEPVPAPEPAAPVSDADAKLLAELKNVADKRGSFSGDSAAVIPDMPRDMTWGVPSKDTILVPLNWKEDGTVSSANPDDSLDIFAGPGEIVELALRKSDSLRAGDFVFVYRRGSVIRSPQGDRKLQLQVSAMLRIKAVGGRVATAEVVRAANPVEVDDIFKK